MDCRKEPGVSARLAIFFGAVLVLSFPAFASAAVMISEVMFDPAGSDTGLEWVEIWNNGSRDENLAGWQLYPDGIGYFTFPDGFTLSAGAYAAVNLRLAGSASGIELYHPSAQSNLGNGAGSLALFKPGERGADTIVSFLRYLKPGSAERKTWESAAVEAGLWNSGEFADIGSFAEGESLGIVNSSLKGKAAWAILKTPTKGAANNSGGQQAISESEALSATENTAIVATTSRSMPLLAIPRLGVQIGTHPIALAGASHRFLGSAIGETESPVNGDRARFLWNFGDGSLAEGTAVAHIYRFPGTYTLSLDVNAGVAIGTVYRDIIVEKAAVAISETESGPDGFVKIANRANSDLDLTGWILGQEGGAEFTIPERTLLKEKKELILPNANTGLVAAGGNFKLWFANLTLAAEAAPSSLQSKPAAVSQPLPAGDSAQLPSRPAPTPAATLKNVKPDELIASGAEPKTETIKNESSGILSRAWASGAALFGVLAGMSVVFLRRKLNSPL